MLGKGEHTLSEHWETIEKLLDYKTELDLNRLSDYVSKFPITTIKIFGVIFDLL